MCKVSNSVAVVHRNKKVLWSRAGPDSESNLGPNRNGDAYW